LLGLSDNASPKRLTFTSNMKEALSEADFVQENGPENPDLKIKLFAEMNEATPSDSIIASSSSGISYFPTTLILPRILLLVLCYHVEGRHATENNE